MTDYEALAALAEAATPGPWRWSNTNRNVYLFGAATKVVMGFARMGMQGAQPLFRDAKNILRESGTENINDYADAAFIAAANPTTVLALIADLREAQAGHTEWYDEATKNARSLVNRTGERDAEKVRADAAEAEVERLRAAVAKKQAETDQWMEMARQREAAVARVRALDGGDET